MLKSTALVSIIVLCVACAGKDDFPEEDPPAQTNPAVGVRPPSKACLTMADRVTKCSAKLQPALAVELLKYAVGPKDPHVKGARRRMSQFFIDEYLRNAAKSRIGDLLKYISRTCENTARARPYEDERTALFACQKTKGCKALGTCLVKHGAYKTLLKAVKKSKREDNKPPLPTPAMLLYHWASLVELSTVSALAGCSCQHWLAVGTKRPGSTGSLPAARKPIPPSPATCRPHFERPLKCADALWSEARDRHRRSAIGNPGLKDTSIDPAEARRRLKSMADKLIPTVVNPKPGHPVKCSLDQLKEMPKDVRTVIQLLARCATEKTCKGYAGCLRRAADMD